MYARHWKYVVVCKNTHSTVKSFLNSPTLDQFTIFKNEIQVLLDHEWSGKVQVTQTSLRVVAVFVYRYLAIAIKLG